MKLLDRLKKSREIARLRRQVRRAPSPTTFGNLAERFIALGELDHAATVADNGLSRFPNSERLMQVRTFAKKKNLAGEIRRLKQDLLRRPSPVAYTQLAEIYRELGNEDEALEMVTECVERFPLSENPYLIQGEIRLERFLRDMIAKDAIVAESALRKVVRLNTHNLKAHVLLAETYHLVGAMTECRHHLRSVLTIMPTARDVQSFLRDLDIPDTDGSEDPEFEELAKLVETASAFTNRPDDFPGLTARVAPMRSPSSSEVDLDGLTSGVLEIADEPGVRNTIVLDKDGGILAERSQPASLSRQEFADLVTSIRMTADDASRRMDTGALVRAEIEGPNGNATVVRVRKLTVAILYADPLRPDRVWELLQDYIARNLTASSEVSSA